MPTDEKQAAVLALQTSFDLIQNRHPSLVAYLDALEARIMAGMQ